MSRIFVDEVAVLIGVGSNKYVCDYCMVGWFSLQQAMKAQRVSRGIPLHFHDLRHLDGGGWSTPHPGLFNPGKDAVPIVQ